MNKICNRKVSSVLKYLVNIFLLKKFDERLSKIYG